jgi:hypothetical protein
MQLPAAMPGKINRCGLVRAYLAQFLGPLWRTECTDMRQPRDKVRVTMDAEWCNSRFPCRAPDPEPKALDLGVSLTGRFSPFGGITGLSPIAMSMIDLANWLGSLGRLGWLVIPAFCLDVQ